MKPKPLSIQRRFVLLLTITFALAIWFLAGAVYISLKIPRDLEEPLKNLNAALELITEFNIAEDEVMSVGAWAYWHPGESFQREFQAAARKPTALLERYIRLPFPPEERRDLESIRQLHARLVEQLSRNIGNHPDWQEASRRFNEARRINIQIGVLQDKIARACLQRLETLSAQLREYTRTLYLLFAGLGLFALLVWQQFRRVHRREIWAPLEELRGMVGEIRRGNLNVTGKVPDSIEFGTLMRGFLDMARELREMRDALEQKVRERAAKLEATQNVLVQAAKLSSLGQLVSGVAHELNNPLTSILGFSELGLARTDLDPRLRHQLQTIRDEALRLKNVVANLSSFARQGPHRTARIDLREVLDRLADFRRYQLGASNIQLHYDRPARPVWVEGDQDQLMQVFFNLVLNSEQAITACRAQGGIWLACGMESGRAWASVRDNGMGMSSAVQARMFDPFFTTKPVGQGSGLGLSISHGIIQQHHGTITAESIEGQGTTFRISLPAAGATSDALPAPAEKPPAQESGVGTGLRALILDDEPAITQLIELFLESRGWSRVVLNDPTALESSLAGQYFDLVICDLKMPGRNGLDVLRLLRQKQPELARRFLLMTGNLADAAERELVELAGVPLLRKPFTLAHLAEVLRSLLADPK